MGFTHLFMEVIMIRLARAAAIFQDYRSYWADFSLSSHHHARPDVFKSEGSKFKDADLEE